MTWQATQPHPPYARHPFGEEKDLWLPPRQMRRYQRNKIIVGLLVSAIFVGWLTLQWSSPIMRLVSAGLVAVTLWTMIQSTANDRRRTNGRQVKVSDGQWVVTTPDQVVQLRLADVAMARWRDDDDPGLWLYDAAGQLLVHLDTDFLADQAEARNFLGWVRRQSEIPFDVEWP